jgi:hypothetical protein
VEYKFLIKMKDGWHATGQERVPLRGDKLKAPLLLNVDGMGVWVLIEQLWPQLDEVH